MAEEPTAGVLTDDLIGSARFRAVLGEFCTGVTVVTAADGDRLAGFACQSFSALSLDPPLVLFCPRRASSSWPIIETAGRFCVNVLADHQGEVSAVFGASRPDRFEVVDWSHSPGGVPVLDGVLAWIECTLETVYDGGDHHVVVGRVVALGGGGSAARPLLYHRSRYTVTAPEPEAEPWLAWSRPDDWI